MKNEISKPVAIAIVVVALLIIAFIGFKIFGRGTAAGPEADISTTSKGKMPGKMGNDGGAPPMERPKTE